MEHVILLSHPALEGRLPGDDGSEIAERVIATTFENLGLEGAFAGEVYRQPFEFRQGGRFSSRDEASIITGFNIGATLPGRGPLATEWVILGAHHDHIGRGSFGSRRGAGQIHEGADDNASGTAAVLLAAELLADEFADSEEPRRSILFITFSGEESGLNGSRHFVENAPFPIDDVALMINLDMVGRIEDGGISINGTGTGTGLKDLVIEAVGSTESEIRYPDGLTSRSDHAEFYRRQVPVLFMSETVFPDEYHTPDDESWRIDFPGGTEAARIAARIAARNATHPERTRYVEIEGFETAEGGPSLTDLKVRFGIKPGNYGDTEPGIVVAGVTADTSASSAGIIEGDRLLAWNGDPITGIREWMLMMAVHEPGDIVTVTIMRDSAELQLPVMLKPRN